MTRHFLICLTACLAACSSCETPMPPGPEPLEMDEVIETLTELQVEHACRETWSCPARSYANTPFLTRHTSEQACNDDNGNLLTDEPGFVALLHPRYTFGPAPEPTSSAAE